MRLWLITGLCAVALMGCAGDKDALPKERPVDEIYNAAATLFENGDYKKAAAEFEEVERQHPYSSWATRAQLMAAFAQYQALDYDSAIATLDRFIQLHPGNSQIDYAFYLRALCFYERIPDVRRDQSITRDALTALQDVVGRFPDTTYARDAGIKIALVLDQLAGAEMSVGRHYLRQGLYGAALGRFQTVVDQYQTTSHAAEALHRMVECYVGLGIATEAQAAAAVLGHNFPGSDWYQRSYDLLQGKNLEPAADQNSWIAKAWNKVF